MSQLWYVSLHVIIRGVTLDLSMGTVGIVRQRKRESGSVNQEDFYSVQIANVYCTNLEPGGNPRLSPRHKDSSILLFEFTGALALFRDKNVTIVFPNFISIETSH